MTAAYDEAVERVRMAKQRGILRPSTDPGWLLTARTVLGPLHSAIDAIQRRELGDADLWVARAWQAIAWSYEDVGREFRHVPHV